MRLAVYRIPRMKPAKDNQKTGFERERLFRRDLPEIRNWTCSPDGT